MASNTLTVEKRVVPGLAVETAHEFRQLTVDVSEAGVASDRNDAIEDDIVTAQRAVGRLRQLRTVDY